MKKKRLQYTIRNVSAEMDCQLREQAAVYNKSLNEATIDVLARGLGMDGGEIIHHDMDELAGTWVKSPVFDEIRKDMDEVDEELWK